MEKKKYLEVIQTKGKKVVKRIDVSEKSDHSIDRIERGMNINLNHTDYYTNVNESKKELPVGDFE